VEDAALLLEAVAGYDPRDPCSADRPVPSLRAGLARRQDLRGVRVGLPSNYFFDQVDPEVDRVVRTAITSLHELGAELLEISIPDLEDMMPLRLALFADGLAFHGPHLREHPELYGEEIRHRLLVDCFVQAHDYARATRVRRLLQERFAAAFQEIDLIAAPGTAIAAVPLEQGMVEIYDRTAGKTIVLPTQLFLLRVTAPANLIGIPALSVPCGFTADGRPVGLQLMGRPWEESLMMQTAYLYEQVAGWIQRRPVLDEIEGP
jgi:aspartyl-tRNA(Asn)/glutamyl-tRNA(Gln) amidotransferase subunit A